MTIRKTIKVPTAPAEESSAPAEIPAAAGATIADRFKLDVPDAAPKKKSGMFATITLLAGLLALGVAGVLTFIIYQHWTFLQGA